MPSLGMGPTSYPFTAEKIDEVVTRTSPGNYALGYVNKESTLSVLYVGRSDTDLKKELKSRLSPRYKRFKFSYATSPKAAFEKECHNYHDFSPPDNKIHPARPAGTSWKCPRCNVFG